MQHATLQHRTIKRTLSLAARTRMLIALLEMVASDRWKPEDQRKLSYRRSGKETKFTDLISHKSPWNPYQPSAYLGGPASSPGGIADSHALASAHDCKNDAPARNACHRRLGVANKHLPCGCRSSSCSTHEHGKGSARCHLIIIGKCHTATLLIAAQADQCAGSTPGMPQHASPHC